MKKNKKPIPLCLVHWLDACGCASDDSTREPIHALRPGFIVEEYEKYIVVAGEVFDDGSWRDGLAVARADIVSITPVPCSLPDEFKGWSQAK